MAFHEARILFYIGMVFLHFIYLITYLGKKIGNCLVSHTSYPVKEWVARFCIQFYRGNSCAILTTVMLFFHKEIQLIKAIKYSAIFLTVVRERFAKPDKSKATFVFNFVAHG